MAQINLLNPTKKSNQKKFKIIQKPNLPSQISSKIFYEYECGEDDTYQSYVASVELATPLVVLPALQSRIAARLEDALWKMSADIGMPAFTITALASLEVRPCIF